MKKTNGTQLKVIVIIFGLLSLGTHFHTVLKQFLLEPNLLDFAYYYVWGDLVHKDINYFRLNELTSESSDILQNPSQLPLPHLRDQPVSTFLPEGFALYSPSFLSLMSLFARMNFVPAAALWTLINYLALILAIFVTAKSLNLKIDVLNLSVFSSLVFSFQPLVESVAIGQANLLILFLLSTVFWAVKYEKAFLAGFLLACALHIKPQYGVLTLLFLIKKQYRYFVSTVFFYGFIAVVTVFVVTLQFQLDYYATLFHLGQYASGLVTWHHNWSLLSALTRLCGEADIFIARVVHGTIAVAVILCVIKLLRRPFQNRLFAFEYSGVILMTLLFLPVMEGHYLVMLYFSIFVLYRHLEDLEKFWQCVFILAFLLLALRYSMVRFELFGAGWLSLLANGKLYGLLLLTAVTFRSWILAIESKQQESH